MTVEELIRQLQEIDGGRQVVLQNLYDFDGEHVVYEIIDVRYSGGSDCVITVY